MKQFVIYATLIALAAFNGIFSPVSFTVFALQGIWYPTFLPSPLNVMFILSGIISGLMHVLLTGVPAAVLEKTIPLNRLATGLVWLGAMLLPTFQTAQHLGWV